jgi:hypothetical protein
MNATRSEMSESADFNDVGVNVVALSMRMTAW